MFAPQCPQCGYPLAGLPGLTCPECGYSRPPPTASDLASRVRQMRDLARQKDLRCRHCRTPLAHVTDDGCCSGCGRTYDFPDSARPKVPPHATPIDPRRTPGWIVLVGFAAVVLLAVMVFVALVL